MSKFQLKAEKRTEPNTKKLVRQEILPGVVFDQKGNSEKIQITNTRIRNILAKATPTSIIELTVGDSSVKHTLIKEVQKNPRTGQIIHLSLMELDPERKTVIPVTLQIKGESPAVKNNLGILITPKETIDLRAFPKDIPESIDVDITKLTNVGDTILVSDLAIPEHLEFIHEDDKKIAVATITPFQKEEEVKPAETEEEVVEGEEEKKPAEEEVTEEDTAKE